MSITIGNYSFEGPYTTIDNLEDRSGVYAILCNANNQYRLIDVGESATVKTRVDNHDRKDCWKRNCSGTLSVAVLYTPNQQQAGRIAIEQAIRQQFNPPCGEE